MEKKNKSIFFDIERTVIIMPIGISTACFYPEETEKALKYCGEIGTQVTEIFFNAPSELEDSFVNELIRIKKYYGLKVVSVHPFTSATEPFMLFSGYKRRFQDGRNLYRRYAEVAKKLGAKYVVLHGDKVIKFDISLEEYTDRFLTVNMDMSAYGIVLTQENVNAFRAASPEFIKKMREYSNDTVQFTFDVKQSIRAGYTPESVLESMGNRVVHVHLSDHGDTGDCILPTSGKYNFEKLFHYMHRINYQGDYVIELYRSAFKNMGDLSKSLNYLREIFTYTICK